MTQQTNRCHEDMNVFSFTSINKEVDKQILSFNFYDEMQILLIQLYLGFWFQWRYTYSQIYHTLTSSACLLTTNDTLMDLMDSIYRCSGFAQIFSLGLDLFSSRARWWQLRPKPSASSSMTRRIAGETGWFKGSGFGAVGISKIFIMGSKLEPLIRF